jgi:hypothetical protein
MADQCSLPSIHVKSYQTARHNDTIHKIPSISYLTSHSAHVDVDDVVVVEVMHMLVIVQVRGGGYEVAWREGGRNEKDGLLGVTTKIGAN